MTLDQIHTGLVLLISGGLLVKYGFQMLRAIHDGGLLSADGEEFTPTIAVVIANGLVMALVIGASWVVLYL